MLTEQARQEYLQALGIESYVPRWALPGAALSPLRAAEEWADSAAEPPGAAVEPDQPGSQGPPRLKAELLSTAINTRSSVIESAAQAPVALPEHRFLLSASRISDDTLVVDSRGSKLALPLNSLLQNIATALGFSSRSLAQAELLRWPLTEASPLADSEQSMVEARAMVQAYLSAQAAKQPIRTLLLMGAAAARHALHAEQQPDNGNLRAYLGKSLTLTLDGTTMEAIVLPSLSAMLHQPAAKAITWKAIKHLRAGS